MTLRSLLDSLMNALGALVAGRPAPAPVPVRVRRR